MAAVAFALLAAVLFGGTHIALRYALRARNDGEMGALASALTALAVCLLLTIVRSQWHGDVLPFLAAGLLAPGLSQGFYVLAVRDAGPSRTAVVVGAAPLVSVTIALLALGEPVSAPLIVGAVLIVAGGLALAGERVRPESFRGIGLFFAFACASLFATRDNVIRWLFRDSTVPPQLGATATLVAGCALMGAYLVARRRGRFGADLRAAFVPFVPPGLLFGSSYAAMFEAFDRGRVTIVSPLIATESLVAVLLAAVLLRRSELVSRHVWIGALLVVGGGALIGVFR